MHAGFSPARSLPAMPARPFPMPALAALVVTGPEARSFLQGQLSSDVAEVTDARGQISAWHDPKGRVLAVLRVMPWAGGFLLVLPAALREAIGKRMRMYVLRAKVQLRDGPPIHGLPPETAREWLAGRGLAIKDAPLNATVADDIGVLRLPGRAGWLLAGELHDGDETDDPRAVAAWERAELEAGLPEVYPATSGEFVAQMLNLDRIGAVSFTKGCYPGQEIVARAHHLGRVKRRARLFRATGAPPAPGESLADSAGIVVRSAVAVDHCLVMAVVAEDAAGPFTLADGRPLEPLP
jgi:tRNA-modifying protein YgfZ